MEHCSRPATHKDEKQKGTWAEPMDWEPSLTYEQRDYHAGDPLIFDLLNHPLLPRGGGFTHDSQCVDVGDGAHGGGRQPGQAEQGADSPQQDDEEQVEMESRTFD